MSGDAPLHEWDAAYVLGALSPDDRRRFEEHLEECPECRASVGELAGIPALLAAGARSDGPVGRPPANAERTALARAETSVLPGLAHRVHRRRIVRRWTIAGASVLAAAAIAAAAVLPTALSPQPAAGTSIALEQTTPSPLSATVDLTAKRWGTELATTCSYSTSSYSTSTRAYALYVTDASGRTTRVASWSAWPGATIHASAAVATPKAQLRTVQVRDVATGKVLLSSPVG